MRLLAYTDLFREMARRHRAIQYTPENGRFLRILLSADPIAKQLDLSEYYGALRSKLKTENQAFLVLENYQLDYEDNQGDHFRRQLHGAFHVLKKVRLGDVEARDAAIDACEEIAEDVLAAVVAHVRADYRTHISVGDAYSEHIGPIGDGHVGVRVNFAWSETATQDLTYNPTKFIS